MVAKPRREQRSSTPLGNAPVAAGGLFGAPAAWPLNIRSARMRDVLSKHA